MNEMKHKVKVTVLDKNSIQNYSNSIVIIQFQVYALVTMWEMSLFFTGMRKEMISAHGIKYLGKDKW